MRRRHLSCWLAGLAVLAGACTKAEVAPLPPPPSLPATTTTTTINFSAIPLAAVPGRTTTTLAVGPGTAGLTGTVTGPDGPLAGAVIHVERLVGDARATMDLVTGPDGTYAVPAILGGRYRMRGWKPAPDNLALLEPPVFFLEGSEQRVVDLTLTRYQGLAVTSAIAPDPPVLGSPGNLVVQVVNQEVDTSGVVRAIPAPAIPVGLSAADWRVLSANPTATDGSGRARWQLDCRRVGPQALSVLVAESAAFALNVAPCVAPPPEPVEGEAPAATATSARPRPTTTTTKR